MMDAETVKMIAESAARTAADHVSVAMREQFRQDSQRLEDRLSGQISADFTRHFGTMDASKHVIQHDRLDRLLKFSDRVSDNLWGKVVLGIVVMGIVSALLVDVAIKKVTAVFGG